MNSFLYSFVKIRLWFSIDNCIFKSKKSLLNIIVYLNIYVLKKYEILMIDNLIKSAMKSTIVSWPWMTRFSNSMCSTDSTSATRTWISSIATIYSRFGNLKLKMNKILNYSKENIIRNWQFSPIKPGKQ